MQQNPTPPTNPNVPDPNAALNRLDKVKEMVKGLADSVNKAYEGFEEGTRNLEEQLSVLNASMASKLGQTQKIMAGLRQEAAIAYPAIVGLGGELVDVQKIQEGIATSLNTNVITMGETVSGLYAGAKAVGMSTDKVGEMVTQFENAGIQTEFIRDNMQSTVNIARKVGVNTGEVFEQVRNNLKRVNEYGFQNGVEGLAKMTTQAAALRINMESVFNFAEKVFDPEGANEMVATFQRMGVAAGDLADPFRLMYLASEDTAELQNQVVKMTEKFTFFNEKTKQFEVFPNAKRDLREIANRTGIVYEDLVKMSTSSQKLSMISKDFKMAGIDEESKQFIANVATYSKEKGGFTVKVKGEQKLVSSLNTQDLQDLKEAQAPVSMEDLARETLTESELQTRTLREIKATLQASAAGSRAPQDLREILRGTISSVGSFTRTNAGNVRAGIQSVNQVYSKTGQSILDVAAGKGGMEEVANVFGVGAKNLEEGIKKITDNFAKFDFDSVGSKYISSGNKLAEGTAVAVEGLTKLGNKATALFSGTDVAKKPGVEKQTTVNQTTNVEFNPLKVQGEVNFNLKSPDGSTQKLSQDQINQILNSAEFQKTIQKMFTDMEARGNYANMPSKK